MKQRRRPQKGGGNASRPTPEKSTATPPHVAPPNPVSLTKATAASAHHLVSPNPSLKPTTTTTRLLSSVKPFPGIKFGVAATTTPYDPLNFVTPRGDEGDDASSPLPTSDYCDGSQNLPAAGQPAADPDSAWRRSARALPGGVGAAGSGWSPAP